MIWHTHADILPALSGDSNTDAALRRFVDDVLNGRKTIALLRDGARTVDAWVTDDPASDQAYIAPGEMLEFRLWDGTSPPQAGV
jgi:hypothetical protein